MENDDPLPIEKRCTVCGCLFQPVHSRLHICKICKQLLGALVVVVILLIISLFC